ncbi:NnrU family protein [Magnetospirillum moscoviense]|uniref:NnrU domain-containing protein n=1 Tax=Magnetospirillum moscoviense TaxID=1437059 RepID=A0A178MMS4_9PROT|nr:NnrU family protein [Magnetospirillum moscoviense]OAN49991.1 hypothetical protein A6A05_01910 [Magnetospirillum moscoviense]
MELAELGLAIALFLFSHSLTNRPGFRRRAEARLGGKLGFILAYSVLSLALLAWIVAAYRAAPVVLLWEQAAWMRWVPPVAMLPGCVLLAGGMVSANPFSIGPGGKGFDPARPGLLRLTRHPVLWGLALWAAAHIVPNGDVGALMVFLPLLGLALVGPRILDAKRRAGLGWSEWARLAALTGRPRWAMITEMGVWRLLAGPALWAILVAGHEMVIGASPLP